MKIELQTQAGMHIIQDICMGQYSYYSAPHHLLKTCLWHILDLPRSILVCHIQTCMGKVELVWYGPPAWKDLLHSVYIVIRINLHMSQTFSLHLRCLDLRHQTTQSLILYALANLANLANLTNLATSRHPRKLKFGTDTHQTNLIKISYLD